MNKLSPSQIFIVLTVLLSVVLIGILAFANRGSLSAFERSLTEMAQKAGIQDSEKFISDYNNGDLRAEVDNLANQGRERGVNATPTVFINNVQTNSIQDYESFNSVVESAVKATQNNEPVIIEIYEDHQCPFCSQFFPIAYQIEAEYKDKVKVEHIPFPLDSIHPLARRYAYAAHAARQQGKYMEMSREIYEREHDVEEQYKVLEEIEL